MKKSYLYSFAITLTIAFLSIGYSAFGSKININDMVAVVRVASDIRITGINVESSEGSGISKNEDYNVDFIFGELELPREDSSVTYKVEVTNFGNLEMGILNITGLPENLVYELNEYELKEKICDSNLECKLGIKKDIYITIKYAEGKYDEDNTNIPFKLDFDFKRFYNITYIGIKNQNYPVEIIDTDTLNLTFKPDTTTSLAQNSLPVDVMATMSGVNLIDDYTYDSKSGNIKIPDISGDIVINRMYRLYEKILIDNTLSDGCPNIVGDYVELTDIEKEKKFCRTNDNYGISYYYRGSTINNYVEFGGYSWRILRVNGDNTVRLIYAGLENRSPNSRDSYPGKSLYNEFKKDNTIINDNAYVGYMYGVLSGNNFLETHDNINNSLLKDSIDNWYINSGLTNYESYLADNLFCNDTTLYNDDIKNIMGVEKEDSDTSLGYAENNTKYSGYYRLVNSASNNHRAYATLKCKTKVNSFTKDDTIYGNGKLLYPVATLTADELALAGALNNIGTTSLSNLKFYLYTGTGLLTMTPSSNIDTFTLSATGGTIIEEQTSVKDRAYRPVINIKVNTTVKSGDGTLENPYILK